MSVRTVTVEQQRVQAAEPAPVRYVVRTQLGRLFDELRRSALFQDIDAIENFIVGIADLQKRNLVLAEFYLNDVLTKDAEQIVEIAERFEAVLGPSLEPLLDQVKLHEQNMRTRQTAKRVLQAQAEAGEAAARDLSAAVEQLGRQIGEGIDRGIAADDALSAAGAEAQRRMGNVRDHLLQSHRVVVTQLTQWNEIVARGQALELEEE